MDAELESNEIMKKKHKPPNIKRRAGAEKGELQHEAKAPPHSDGSPPSRASETSKTNPTIYDKQVGCKTGSGKDSKHNPNKSLPSDLAKLYTQRPSLCKRAIKIVFGKRLPETIEILLRATTLVLKIVAAIYDKYWPQA